MAKKTKRDQELEALERQRLAFEHFKRELSKARTIREAHDFLETNRPPVDASGRSYYSSLQWFLENGSLPGGADAEEGELYLNLIQRQQQTEPSEKWDNLANSLRDELSERWPALFEE